MNEITCHVCMNDFPLPAEWKQGNKVQCPFCYADTEPGERLDLSSVEQSVQLCCRTESECGDCKEYKCLVGFAKRTAAESVSKGMVRIPQGEEMIPKGDYKVYDEESLKESIIDILLSCQSCEDNHHPDCTINIVRTCMETALFGESLDYKGSTFAYLMDVTKLNPKIGEELAVKYRNQKN